MSRLVLGCALLASFVGFHFSFPVAASECDPRLLEQARRAMRAENLSQARAFLDRVKDCEGQLGATARTLLEEIDRKEVSLNLWSRAQIALGQGDREQACELLLMIEEKDPGFPGLLREKARAGGCDEQMRDLRLELEQARQWFADGQWSRAQNAVNKILRQRPDFEEAVQFLGRIKDAREAAAKEALERDYAAAERLVENREWAKAKTALESLVKNHPNYRDVQSLLRKTNDALRSARAASQPLRVQPTPPENLNLFDSVYRERYDELCDRAEKELGEGRARLALELAKEAGALLGGDSSRADSIAAKVQEALRLEREEMELIVETFYRGQYEACVQRCRVFLGKERDSVSLALALFFEANSKLSLGLLNNDLGDDEREAAGRLIQRAVEANPGVTYWWSYVSPKLRNLIQAQIGEEASGQPTGR